MEYSINFDALISQLKNEAYNKMIERFTPDEKSKKDTLKLLRALNKRGVATETFVEALIEASTEE